MAIGTIGALALSSGVSAVAGMSSANKAADIQQEASQDQIALQKDIFNQQKEMFSPFLGAGENALAAYNYELGMGPKPTFGGYTPTIEEYTIAGTPAVASGPTRRPHRSRNIHNNGRVPNALTAGTASRTGYRVDGKEFATRQAAQQYVNQNTVKGQEYGGYKKTPGYDFRLNEGLDAVQAGVGARHGLNSGATMKAMNEYGQDYATGEYNNHLNRLLGQVNMGQSSAAMTATAGNNYASGASNALANYGDAGAAGAIGVGNAIQGGINNGMSAWMYGKGQGIF